MPEVPGRAGEDALAGRVAAARDAFAAGWGFELDPAFATGRAFELAPALAAGAFELDPAFAGGLALAAVFFAGARGSERDLSAVLALAALAGGADLRTAPVVADFGGADATVFEAAFEPECGAAFFVAAPCAACPAELVCF